jgi:hypothetical protein
MSSSLAFLKGGADQLPRGVVLPLTVDGRFIRRYASDTIKASRDNMHLLNRPDSSFETVFQRQYHIVCPLPSSKGPASPSNMALATTIASSLTSSPAAAVHSLVLRHRPMETKSTSTDRFVRMDKDAPRNMHFDTIVIDKQYLTEIHGASILLYDDVFTWGNTSEAARNLLLMLGAAEVDVLTCFATEPAYRSSIYDLTDDAGASGVSDIVSDAKLMGKEKFQLKQSTFCEKHILGWHQSQESFKAWHDNTFTYVKQYFPEFVPNDIPWA